MIPVHRAWKDPKVDLGKYNKRIVNRVGLSEGIKLTELEKTNIDAALGAFTPHK